MQADLLPTQYDIDLPTMLCAMTAIAHDHDCNACATVHMCWKLHLKLISSEDAICILTATSLKSEQLAVQKAGICLELLHA